jgi:hypothetical protein
MFDYPSTWTLNPINEHQHYAATLAFLSSETASAQASCGPDYLPGLGGECQHMYDLPDGSLIVTVSQFSLPGHGIQTVAADLGAGGQSADVAGMPGVYLDPYTASDVPSAGHTFAWEFAAPNDTITSYTIIATDNGYPDAAAVLQQLLSTVTVTSSNAQSDQLDQYTAEEVAKAFYLGVHKDKVIGDWTINSELGVDDLSARPAWQVEIHAPVTEPNGGATYASAFKLSIDAVTGAVRVVAQG